MTEQKLWLLYKEGTFWENFELTDRQTNNGNKLFANIFQNENGKSFGAILLTHKIDWKRSEPTFYQGRC